MLRDIDKKCLGFPVMGADLSPYKKPSRKRTLTFATDDIVVRQFKIGDIVKYTTPMGHTYSDDFKVMDINKNEDVMISPIRDNGETFDRPFTVSKFAVTLKIINQQRKRIIAVK